MSLSSMIFSAVKRLASLESALQRSAPSLKSLVSDAQPNGLLEFAAGKKDTAQFTKRDNGSILSLVAASSANHANSFGERSRVELGSYNIFGLGHALSPEMAAAVQALRMSDRHITPIIDLPTSAPITLPEVDAPGISAPPEQEEEGEGVMQCGGAGRGNTHRPSKRKRINKHGMEKRLGTANGRLTLERRMNKGRWRLTKDAFV